MSGHDYPQKASKLLNNFFFGREVSTANLQVSLWPETFLLLEHEQLQPKLLKQLPGKCCPTCGRRSTWQPVAILTLILVSPIALPASHCAWAAMSSFQEDSFLHTFLFPLLFTQQLLAWRHGIKYFNSHGTKICACAYNYGGGFRHGKTTPGQRQLTSLCLYTRATLTILICH